jgi:hypothetical protein
MLLTKTLKSSLESKIGINKYHHFFQGQNYILFETMVLTTSIVATKTSKSTLELKIDVITSTFFFFFFGLGGEGRECLNLKHFLKDNLNNRYYCNQILKVNFLNRKVVLWVAHFFKNFK